MGCTLFKLSFFLENFISWKVYLVLWAIWTILYVEAHWLFCWHYYECSIEVQRSISFDFRTSREKFSRNQKIEIAVTLLIVVAFTLNAILVPDFINSLYYDCLILFF